MYKFLLIPSGIFASDDDAAARKRREIAARMRGGADGFMQDTSGIGRDGTIIRGGAPPPRPAAPSVRYDGIYTFWGGSNPSEYLRFYEDGNVIFAMLSSNYKIKIDWFVKGQKRHFKERSVGESRYTISGKLISFSIWYDDSFMVKYHGEIADNGLLLKLYKDYSNKTRDFLFTKF